MAKKRSFSSSENEKGNTVSISSKTELNKLVHNANITYNNQVLKHGLQNSKLKNIANGLEDSEDVDNTELKQSRKHTIKSKSKISKEIRNIRRGEVSSSSESSEQERYEPLAIKESKSSTTGESVLNDFKVLGNNRRNSCSDDVSISNQKTKKSKSKIPPALQNVESTESSSENEEKLQSVDQFQDQDNKTGLDTMSPLKKRKSNEGYTTSILNSNDTQNRFMGKHKIQIKSNNKNNTSESDSDASYLQDSLRKHEKTMEDFEQKMDKTKSPERLSSIKNRVNVLQNVCLTPPKEKSLRRRLEENFPDIKQIKNNMSLEFSDTEDIFLFRVPKNVEPSSLQNVELDLEEKCKINIGKKYNIGPTRNIPPPILAVSDNSKILHFRGSIEMEKHVKSKKDPNIVIPESKPVPLPDNLKKRHPLFGSDYKQKIQLSEHVKQKVDDAIEVLLKKERMTKKRKHKKAKLNDIEDNKNETIFMLLNNHGHQNEKNIKQETLDNNASNSSSTNKLNNINSYTDSVNETLNRIKSEIFTETESDFRECVSLKKKKKKKHRDNSLNETLPKISSKNHTEIKTEPSHLYEYENKLNSTLIPDMSKTPSFSPEVSRITLDGSNSEKTPKKIKKKRERNEDVIEKQLISNILDKLKSDLTPKKVKKKKRNQSE